MKKPSTMAGLEDKMIVRLGKALWVVSLCLAGFLTVVFTIPGAYYCIQWGFIGHDQRVLTPLFSSLGLILFGFVARYVLAKD